MAAYNTKINITGEFESLALTDILGVKYAIEADNKRKANNTYRKIEVNYGTYTK